MLKPEENERLVRVGRGTPAGELMRRYWLPAVLASELPEPDCPPVRVRLLAENLVAFRDTQGRVGLVDAFCPHRRAPLFFGRNEECGLRCVYHGWKFDVDGTCVDMPSEPPDTPMKKDVRLLSYPTAERGGVVWAYLGPRAAMPAPPDYEWVRAPATHRHVSKTFEACNYLQALEGGLDTAHSSFLHNNDLANRNRLLRARDGAPRLDIEVTDYGYTYVGIRKSGEAGNYVRIYHYVMPAQQMRASTQGLTGGRAKVPKLDGHIWVPIDDEHTHVFNWALAYDEAAPLTPDFIDEWETYAGRSEDDLIPGTFVLKRNVGNDFLIDREVQKTRTFTGIKGLNTQDFALQQGMGPIVDRSQEMLGTTDRAIVTMRRLLLEATRAVERGEAPKGVDPRSYRAVRPNDSVIPATANWREALAGELVAKW
ncbi:MAG TPA: Rieske 2Fe-2S domain-containing protein [Stellaceae bacterium]|nr:Rieske 2Fe-2S domain-containing protein [Stellaceae bacterium]